MRGTIDELSSPAPTHAWREKSWGKITKVTLGYGYLPQRALMFLAGVIAVSCALA